jgi:heptosyltransferase III
MVRRPCAGNDALTADDAPQHATATQGRLPVASGRGNAKLRLLDRTLGIALLAAVGKVRRKHERPPTRRRIGVMKTAGIGDMILASAVVRDVIREIPDADVVLFAGPDNNGVAEMIEGVRVVPIRTAEPWSVIPLLRSERLDVLLDLGQWTRLEAMYAALSGAGWIAGFATPGQRRHYAYDVWVPHRTDVRELDNFRALIGLLGVECNADPTFAAGPPDHGGPAPQPYVVFHLWAGGYRSELREWPPECWRQLLATLVAERFSIVLTGGPGDTARTDAFVASCGQPAPHLVSIAGRYPLSKLTGVLAQASCVVSVNTGVMHLAAAVGAPTIALNGPTSSLRWGPIGRNVICMDSELPGCGFLNLGFEYDGQRTDCMHGISVERVTAAVLELAERAHV